MSKKIELSKNPLPDQLAEIEASLAQVPLPANSVNRDELMYRAGWAAAETAILRPQPRIVSHWLWPATSAALAATVLVLLFPLGTERVNLEEAKQVASTQPAPAVLSEAPPPASEATVESRFVPRFDSHMSVLALRRRTMLRDIGKAPEEIAFDDTPSPPIKTTRELLYELLPELQDSIEEDVQQNELWTWPKQLWEALS